jgi:hypothetical protein
MVGRFLAGTRQVMGFYFSALDLGLERERNAIENEFNFVTF